MIDDGLMGHLGNESNGWIDTTPTHANAPLVRQAEFVIRFGKRALPRVLKSAAACDAAREHGTRAGTRERRERGHDVDFAPPGGG
eukprot:4918847-Prymnesium_polylepis.1